MLRRIFRNLLGLVLTAMMLATSVIPPGYRHAHEGGNDLSHGHADVSHSVSNRSAGNEYIGTCHDIQSFDGCSDETSLGDDKTHLHFKIFGISVALPDTNRSSKSGEDSHDNQFASIRASEDILPVSQSNTDARNWLVLISQEYSPQSVMAISAISHSLQSATPTLLCDRARHERSGVQLI
jgi:hypothetical protein